MNRVAGFVGAALALAAAGCGGAEAPEPAAAEASSATRSTTASVDRDARLLTELCDTYCAALQAQAQMCPTGTTDMMECRMPLAEGIDNVDALADRAAVLDRSDPERYEDLDRSITDAVDAYDTWSDHTECSLVHDINDPHLVRIYGQQELIMCSLEASTTGMALATVGHSLRNAAQAAG